MLDTVVTQVGIGTTWTGSRLYVTQVFRKPDGTTVNAPGIAPRAPPPPRRRPPPPPVDLGLAACPKGLPTGQLRRRPDRHPRRRPRRLRRLVDARQGHRRRPLRPGTPRSTARQVASLVARQLQLAGRLPVATRDYFRDDNGTPHQANINALAEVGILNGTQPGVFSPVPRA